MNCTNVIGASLRAVCAVGALALFLLICSVAPPAVGQTTPAAVAVAVQISAFSIDSGGPFKAGDRLRATLTGSPGGRASFTVLNVSGEVPMVETGPGVYTGVLTIPKNSTVVDAAAVGRLVGKDGTPAPLLAARQLVTIENTPPAAFAQTPSPGAVIASTQPLVYASLAPDGGAEVNPRSIRLLLDGQDVTAGAQTSAGFVAYRPVAPLSPGKHEVILVAQDRLGNQMRAEWSFRVVGDSQNLLLSAVTNPAGSAVSAGHPLAVTLHGPPGRRATCSLPAISRSFPLSEISPGTYEGTYSPDPGASCPATPVVAAFKDGDIAILDHPVATDSGPPPKPSIEEPGAEIEIGDTLDIAGRASPGAMVLVSLAYKSRSDTGLFEIDGAALSASAHADDKGNWKIAGLSLSVPWLLTPDRVTRFLVQATAVDSLGRRSQTVISEVMHS